MANKNKNKLPLLTIVEVLKWITENGQFRKVKQIKLESGKFRYQIKDMTDAEYAISEDTPDAVADAIMEKGGWVVLDGFTASAMKQVYDFVTNPEKNGGEEKAARFAELYEIRSLNALVNFTWKVAK
jgi:hypothetical protein